MASKAVGSDCFSVDGPLDISNGFRQEPNTRDEKKGSNFAVKAFFYFA